MNKQFTVEEIVSALKRMNPTKAPSPDGAHTLFFQHYWEGLKDEFMSICMEILNEGKDMGPINNSFIALIPKTRNPKRMEEYIPISQCNVVYKVVAKVIAHRLKKVLDQIISQTQSAFVPGRLITDNVVVGF
ncbi:MAG: reverse transcriptase domain-containing protein [Sweet potato little leaf phytoplasma]|nr:reverse transcriptase domain-containing protein [Sweet potato little leaf phytoplasma]